MHFYASHMPAGCKLEYLHIIQKQSIYLWTIQKILLFYLILLPQIHHPYRWRVCVLVHQCTMFHFRPERRKSMQEVWEIYFHKFITKSLYLILIVKFLDFPMWARNFLIINSGSELSLFCTWKLKIFLSSHSGHEISLLSSSGLEIFSTQGLWKLYNKTCHCWQPITSGLGKNDASIKFGT